LRPVAFGLVLLVSLSRYIVVWDRILIGESVGISLTALLVAAWIAFARRPSWYEITAVVFATLLWAFVREIHAFLLLLLAAGLGASLLFRRARGPRAVAFVATLLIAAWGIGTVSSNPERRRFAMLNVIGQRVLVDQGLLEHFRSTGMPVSPELLSLAGKFASSDDWLFYKSESLREFRDWVDHDFPIRYSRFLLAHPTWSLVVPFRDARFWGQNIEVYITGRPGILPQVLEEAVAPRRPALLVVMAVVGGLACYCAFRCGWSRTWLVPVLLIASTLPHTLVAWHGDAMEVDRHLVPVAVNLRLGIALLFLLGLDSVLGCGSPDQADPSPCPAPTCETPSGCGKVMEPPQALF